MPTRIYALAKELKFDSKELVDICTKAGIPGKGSALASLDDDEVKKLKAYLAKPAAGESPPPRKTAEVEPEIQPMTRDDSLAPVVGKGKIKVVTGKKSKLPVKAKQEEPPADDPPASPTEAEEQTTEPVAETPPDAPVPPDDRPQMPEMSRPSTAPKKPKNFDKPTSSGDGPKRTPKRRAPVINVAPMPEVKQPTPSARKSNEKVQKPVMALPKEAIADHKRGVKAPLDNLTRGKGKGKGKAGATPIEPQTPPDAESPLGRRGRGKGKGGVDRGLADMASTRAERQQQRKTRARSRQGVDDSGRQRHHRRVRTLTRKGTNTAAPRKGKVALELPCTVRSFSEAAGISSVQVQGTLMKLGVMATINSQIEDETAELLAVDLGLDLEFKQQESLEDQLIVDLDEIEDDPASLEPRAPIVTFLGHVDHGKTSLLDYLIGINVVSGEAGGITQHIRAYQVNKDGRSVAFVDTPGHEAFTEMRARGANVTDIAVLVIAADDGIMPQTEEAISHAKAAEVPIVVALNKSDLPGADANRVMTQLTEYDLTPSAWGGETEVVETSAITGQGMDELLDTLLTIAELNEYQANPKRHAVGTCLEAQQEGGRGVVAKVMVQNGTLKVGDVVVCGGAHGRVKAMYDTLRANKRIKQAGPSMPVNLTGLDIAPGAGDAFHVLDDIAKAREIAASRSDRSRTQSLAGISTKISFEEFQARLEEGRLTGAADEVVTLNLIIRADVRGSIEAIEKELGKLEHPEVQVKILHKAVGGVTVGDVQLASTAGAVIVAFNVVPDDAARSLADDRGVEVRRYDIIYKVTDDIRAMLEGKLKPEEHILELGRALVKQTFSISRVGTIAGCYVMQGSIERHCRIRVIRDGRVIGDYPLDTLRRVKDDVKEVPRGMECGMKLAGFNDVKQDDMLEAYKIEEVARKLESSA